MERLLGLPAHGDFLLQLHVLPGKLLEHAVDGSRKRVEFVRSAARRDTAREITVTMADAVRLISCTSKRSAR